MRPLAYALLASTLLVACPSTALDLAPDATEQLDTAPPPPPAIPTVRLGPDFMAPLLPFNDALVTALADRDHPTSEAELKKLTDAHLKGVQVPDRDFLLAWVALRRGKGAEVAHLIDVIGQAEGPPRDYRDLTHAELLIAADRHVEALPLLEAIPRTSRLWPRSRILAAQAHHKVGATTDAEAAWQELVDREDPSDGSDIALWALAQRKGIGSPTSYTYLRRLWTHYPTSRAGAKAEKALLANYPGAKHKPSNLEVAMRAERLMYSWRFESATKLYDAEAARFSKPSEASCIAWYTYGRSHFKRNNVTKAASVLVPAGTKCAGIDGDRGAKALYVAGKAHERKKEWNSAAKAFRKIPQLYPEHTMADDGYALAGVALQIADRPTEARDLWTRQVTEVPNGDLAAEGFWRLAWTAYLSGDTATAIRWAEQMVATVDYASDPVHVSGARYWAARWRLYPSYDNPTQLTTDVAKKAEGIELLVKLCTDHPTRFYSLMAAARLHELAPERVKAIGRPEAVGAPGDWTVRQEFYDQPAVQRAAQLVRIGLASEALNELDSLDRDSLSPSEEAFITSIEALKNPIAAHDHLHKYLLHHPPTTLGPDRDRILQQAYPNRYWDLVQKVAGKHDFDPRIFHALVREESSFNPNAKSWAGARGLSQLMPATARHVAGRMGISVNSKTITDPETNLSIGSWYLDYLHDYFGGNSFLAVPAYNAGEGNVGKWAREWGGRPTDEYVEAIPIRETRHYVKRVLGTYQLYNVVWGTGPVYPDWSAHVHQAWKK